MTELTNEERRAAYVERCNALRREKLREEFGDLTLAERIDAAPSFWKLDVTPKHGYDNTFEPLNLEFGRSVTYDGTTYLGKRHMIGVTADDRGVQAYAFGLGSCLTAQRRAKTPGIEIRDGDVFEVVVNGEYVHFVASWKRAEYLYLHRINADGSIEPRVEKNGEVSHYG